MRKFALSAVLTLIRVYCLDGRRHFLIITSSLVLSLSVILRTLRNLEACVGNICRYAGMRPSWCLFKGKATLGSSPIWSSNNDCIKEYKSTWVLKDSFEVANVIRQKTMQKTNLTPLIYWEQLLFSPAHFKIMLERYFRNFAANSHGTRGEVEQVNYERERKLKKSNKLQRLFI